MRIITDRSATRGATILEFSVSFIVIIICIFGLIESMRYVLVQSTLSKAAIEGMNYAQKISGLDLDIRGCTSVSCDSYERFFSARRAVVSQAKRYLQANIAESTKLSSPERLTEYRIADELNNFAIKAPSFTAEVLFLRPGEYAEDLHTGKKVSHPTMCSPVDSNCIPGLPRITDSSSWPDVIKNNPLFIQIGAVYRPIIDLPFFNVGEIYVKGTALGYREPPTNTKVPPDMSFPIPPILPPPPPPTPIPTPPCVGDYCGGNCLGSCTGGTYRNWGNCQCEAGCAGQICQATGACVASCQGAQTLDSNCVCGCSGVTCPGGATPDINCNCPPCSLTCGDGTPNANCSACVCPAAPCPIAGQNYDSQCNCTGSCPTGTSVCGNSCVADPVQCEKRDSSCNIVPDCASCGKALCSGACITSPTCSQPGSKLSSDGCTCECTSCTMLNAVLGNDCSCYCNPENCPGKQYRLDPNDCSSCGCNKCEGTQIPTEPADQCGCACPEPCTGLKYRPDPTNCENCVCPPPIQCYYGSYDPETCACNCEGSGCLGTLQPDCSCVCLPVQRAKCREADGRYLDEYCECQSKCDPLWYYCPRSDSCAMSPSECPP